MGKIQFTKKQQIILNEVAQNKWFSTHFYFTGGTALSSFYLHHRFSDDLDFFSEEKFDNQIIFTLMEELGQKHNFTFQSRFMEVTYIFNLQFKDGENLKVDFGYYPYKKVEREMEKDGLNVDSLLDIAVNKLLTVSQRTEVKDFVDLYFLLQKFTIWDLMEGVKVKFKIKMDPFLIGIDLLKAEGFDYLPKMIKPLTLDDLKSFFRDKAQKLSKRSIE
ncbi:MAG: nucleotidyl transferase AbiEii/AbiGii toxin family protein [Candidatus Daviesbacteria bacterium]|nr:nucleotidyl transferase AbiEii/AbiGii toxin family protein [Candidatus Daviesbacteria bacterium]